MLVRLQRLRPPHALHEIHGEHPAGRQLRHHLGDTDKRMISVCVSKGGLVGGLDAVVDFFADPGRHFPGHRAHIEPIGAGHDRSDQL
jgi:hypothetical protein